ncbi:glycosyltransferase family 4 protein [Winogradskyella litorisediminis]|uniref:Glycosyltransferase family 4 protein n=1 Tax=Winogradskyella litorisediminis TaxID=1156618 RepID=A0ABW3NBK9_9FLAO
MSVSKKHIVLLTSEFPPLPGGIGNHAYNLAEHLVIEGYKVTVIADQRGNGFEDFEFDKGLKCNLKRVAKTSPRFLMYLKRIRLCFKLLKSADVFICSGKFPLWVGAFLEPFHSAERIAIIHGTEVNFSDLRLRKSINWSLKRFDKVVAVSNYTKSLVAYLDLKNIRVIPNGYTIKPLSLDKKTIFELVGEPSLLTVGNVTKRKGQANVIRHLPKLKALYPGVHYHCIGLETERQQCEDLATSLGVLNHISFWGHVSESELVAVYKSAQIFTMLSQTTASGDVEGFGIALIEANHFGLPTIGAKDCGIEDAISHGKSGLLIDGTNSEEFVDAVNSILNDRIKYSENAKRWAKVHDWKTIIKRYVKYIEE